jgi:hypothetical protein
MNENRIVYVSFGGQKFEDQTRYSVLTLLHLLAERQRDDYRIVVYTDRPERVPQHPWVTAERIDPADLGRWRGPLENVHRIRLEVLHRAVATYGLPLVYVDSDTRWLELPDEPFAKLKAPLPPGGRLSFYMHAKEGTLSPSFHPPYLDYLSTHAAVLARVGLQAEGPWVMWNAGVMGVPKGAEDFFAGVMQVHDVLLPRIRPRNFVDQLIISLQARARFDLNGFEFYLHHYWDFSQEAPVLLRAFLGGIDPALPVAEQARHCGEHDWNDEALRRIRVESSGFHRWRNKVRNSLRKRRLDVKALWLRASARVPAGL